MIDAILLAGAENRGALKDVSPAAAEAMIEIDGRPMIGYVIAALRESRRIGRIVVVGPSDVAAHLRAEGVGEGVTFLESGASMIDNLFKGFDHLSGDRRVLIVTSDVPLLSAAAIDDFLERCNGRTADLYYPIIPKEASEARYPGIERTYVRLREGTFTGGNLALLAPDVVKAGRAVMEQAFAMRKKPIQLARLFGIKFIFKLLFRRLSVSELEQGAFRVLGFQGAAIVTPYPEIGVDVDKPSDLQVVESVLRERRLARTGR